MNLKIQSRGEVLPVWTISAEQVAMAGGGSENL